MVFAKAPQPGVVKTRLISVLGADGAAALHASLLIHTMATARKVAPEALELHGTEVDHGFLRFCAEHFAATLLAQSGGDLGARMHAAFEAAFSKSRFAVLIGCDCPVLTPERVRRAFRALARGHDAVFYPAEDGGYALIGLARCDKRLFADIGWSTANVMQETRTRIRALGWRSLELETLWDIDRQDDYARLLRSGVLWEACDHSGAYYSC